MATSLRRLTPQSSDLATYLGNTIETEPQRITCYLSVLVLKLSPEVDAWFHLLRKLFHLHRQNLSALLTEFASFLSASAVTAENIACAYKSFLVRENVRDILDVDMPILLVLIFNSPLLDSRKVLTGLVLPYLRLNVVPSFWSFITSAMDGR